MENFDENKVSKINLTWFNFLELFFSGQSHISYDQNENGYVTYNIENVLNTSITLSSKYGFVSLIFNDLKSIDEFKEIVKSVHKNAGVDEGIFPREYFPSRVYLANKLTLSFYDQSNKYPDKQKFANRLIVFESIFDILLRFKISREKSLFFDSLE